MARKEHIMGYYTYHELETNGNTEEHKDNIEELSEYVGLWEDSCKWYNHQEDMKAYSKQHPNVVFSLFGDGEEVDDRWVEYYMDGKVQEELAKIVYPPFDKSLLK
jgi:hypothetical protein